MSLSTSSESLLHGQKLFLIIDYQTTHTSARWSSNNTGRNTRTHYNLNFFKPLCRSFFNFTSHHLSLSLSPHSHPSSTPIPAMVWAHTNVEASIRWEVLLLLHTQPLSQHQIVRLCMVELVTQLKRKREGGSDQLYWLTVVMSCHVMSEVLCTAWQA